MRGNRLNCSVLTGGSNLSCRSNVERRAHVTTPLLPQAAFCTVHDTDVSGVQAVPVRP